MAQRKGVKLHFLSFWLSADLRFRVHVSRGRYLAHEPLLLLAVRCSTGRQTVHARRRPAALSGLLSEEIWKGNQLKSPRWDSSPPLGFIRN